MPDILFVKNDACLGTGHLRLAISLKRKTCTWFVDDQKVLEVRSDETIHWFRPPAYSSCRLGLPCQGDLSEVYMYPEEYN